MFKSKRKQAAELKEHGTQAAGTIVNVEDTGVTVNDNPRVRLTLQIKPPDEPAFEARKTVTVSRVQIPRPGETYIVWYDPADRDKFAYGVPQTAEAQAAVAAALGQSASGGTEATAAPRDPLDRLKELGELRDAGVLTPEEFEAQKAKILADM